MKPVVTVVALADTHLSSTVGHVDNGDRLAAWDQVIDYMRETQDGNKGVDLWVHAGDVFDEASTVGDRLAAADRFQIMALLAPGLVIYGNHDAPGDLDLFGRLQTRFPIYVVREAQTVRVKLSGGGSVAIFALPYPHKAQIVAAGVSPEDVGRAADEALDVLFAQAAAALDAASDRGEVAFAVGHATIAGATSSTGQPMIGREISVKPTHLARLQPFLQLFGHIHLPQEIYGAHYIGSGCRLDYGETEPKRFIHARLSPKAYVVESIPLGCPPRYRVEGDLTRDGYAWQLRKGPNGPVDDVEPVWSGSDVKAVVRYEASERSALDVALASVRDIFKGARRVDVEPVSVDRRELRSPEVVQAQGIPDKLKAWAETSGVSWSETIARCADLLLSNADDAQLVAAAVKAAETEDRDGRASSRASSGVAGEVPRRGDGAGSGVPQGAEGAGRSAEAGHEAYRVEGVTQAGLFS